MVSEEYYSYIKDKYNSVSYCIFVNPDRKDITDLQKEIKEILYRKNATYLNERDNVRFMIYEHKLYVWVAEILHEDVIRHLGFDLDSEYTESTPIDIALFGVATITQNGLLQISKTYSDASIRDKEKIKKIYSNILNKFFTSDSIDRFFNTTWRYRRND